MSSVSHQPLLATSCRQLAFLLQDKWSGDSGYNCRAPFQAVDKFPKRLGADGLGVSEQAGGRVLGEEGPGELQGPLSGAAHVLGDCLTCSAKNGQAWSPGAV